MRHPPGGLRRRENADDDRGRTLRRRSWLQRLNRRHALDIGNTEPAGPRRALRSPVQALRWTNRSPRALDRRIRAVEIRVERLGAQPTHQRRSAPSQPPIVCRLTRQSTQQGGLRAVFAREVETSPGQLRQPGRIHHHSASQTHFTDTPARLGDVMARREIHGFHLMAQCVFDRFDQGGSHHPINTPLRVES